MAIAPTASAPPHPPAPGVPFVDDVTHEAHSVHKLRHTRRKLVAVHARQRGHEENGENDGEGENVHQVIVVGRRQSNRAVEVATAVVPRAAIGAQPRQGATPPRHGGSGGPMRPALARRPATHSHRLAATTPAVWNASRRQHAAFARASSTVESNARPRIASDRLTSVTETLSDDLSSFAIAASAMPDINRFEHHQPAPRGAIGGSWLLRRSSHDEASEASVRRSTSILAPPRRDTAVGRAQPTSTTAGRHGGLGGDSTAKTNPIRAVEAGGRGAKPSS